MNRFMSPKIQNKSLEVMALKVVHEIADSIRCALFFTIMADETTDTANKEQVVIVLRWVGSGLSINEEFIRVVCCIDSIQALMLKEVIKDILTHLNLSVCKIRGQCYDGAATMAGCRNGLAKFMKDDEPRALYTHCYGHSLNLVAWRPHPFPHAKEEQFSRRRAWYQPTKVMFLSTILLTINLIMR